ncbi:MAG: lipid A deacylase LpxR family protein [Verrucomicrobia bacterium]|nr:lipid A deacylase LpxR family protein [Verrucomicrobiota bacterium]
MKLASITNVPLTVAAILLLLSLRSLPADGVERPVADTSHGTWSLSVDNDLFANKDNHYTSGVQLGWLSGKLEDFREAPGPALLVPLLHSLPWVNDAGRQRFVSYSLAHRILTPDDIANPAYIPEDMPYSGLLLGTLTAGAQDAAKMDAFSLIAGLVGPSAMGEQMQRGVHQTIGSARPMGWAHQLHDEPILNLDYEHRWRVTTRGSRRGWGGDLIGQSAVAAGNLLSSATLGLGGRWGWRVPDDFGLPPQFFGEESIGSRPFSEAAGDRGVWLFALVNASAFANAIFWDGNTFRASHAIDYEPWIARAYTGLRVRHGRWGASFAFAITTVPWTNPENRHSQRYGRVGLTYSY